MQPISISASFWRWTLLLVVGATCNACQEPPPPPAQSIPPVELAFSFRSAARSRQASCIAQLDYAVAAPAGELSMQLTDPEQPRGAEVKLDLCTIKAKPYVCKPRISHHGMQQCKVNCVYTLCVRDAGGTHVGDFEINDWSALVIKSATVADELEYKLYSTSERALYFIYRKSRSGGAGELLFALEYVANQGQTLRELSASDGWHYTFWAPDGRLLVHHPSSLGGLADEMVQQSYGELAQRDAAIEEMEQQRKSCRSGGG